MDVVLKEHLKAHISRLSGENFQNFTDFLFTKKYGSSFRVLRHHRDMGCDGIINNKTVIAVYGPENGRNTLSSFKIKFSTDLQKYRENWSKVYPEFYSFTIPHSLGKWLTLLTNYIKNPLLWTKMAFLK